MGSFRIAAIDAGTNGIRLAIAEILPTGEIIRLDNHREAIRLGVDAFERGEFSAETIDTAVKGFKRFRKAIEKYNVTHLRAVATSAARESRNTPELVRQIRQQTGIELAVIDGIEEAQLVFAAVNSEIPLEGKSALLIDMGGGSVEVTVARNGLAVGCESLRVGTVRLLQRIREGKLDESDVDRLIERYRGSVRSLVNAELEDAPLDLCIGTGGNIVRMGKLRVQLLGKVKNRKMKLSDLDSIIAQLTPMTLDERMKKLSMRPDRADVIVIACIIMRMILSEVPTQRVLIPQVGLKDGLLYRLARFLVPKPPPRMDEEPTLWDALSSDAAAGSKVGT